MKTFYQKFSFFYSLFCACLLRQGVSAIVPPIFQIAPDLYSGKGKWNHWSVRMGLRPEPVVPLAERLQEAPAE
ncbi:MAG: hypothetical protein C6P37_16205 [Caldibacillus debilis]|uniref:Uncharacterized protein n=1 Tax=Caldibacillus debilis TaxID=301148 RepID=A0A3E0JW08_9BACI|nr:MAG: hypothetical protein C6P37_16205 [Caldibacillus debilis]